MDGKDLKGRPLKVNQARERKDFNQGGGGFKPRNDNYNNNNRY